MQPLEVLNKFNIITYGQSHGGLDDIIAEDIIFEGPLFQASGKKDFIKGFQRWIQTKKTYTVIKQFVDGSDIATISDIIITVPNGTVTLKEADLVHINPDGKIDKIRVHFDPRELLKATGR